MTTRRAFLGFLATAPFIVKASSLMPVRALVGTSDGVALFSAVHPYNNNLIGADLSEASLITVMAEIRRTMQPGVFSLRPTRYIVAPTWFKE